MKDVTVVIEDGVPLDEIDPVIEVRLNGDFTDEYVDLIEEKIDGIIEPLGFANIGRGKEGEDITLRYNQIAYFGE